VLATDRERGLSRNEVQSRLRQYGYNELRFKPPVPIWQKFLAQFTDVLVILLIVAAAVSAGLWLYERDSALPYEALAIAAIVFLNAMLGFMQQIRAEKALAALQQMSAGQANVIRDGKPASVAAAELVPGDIVIIEQGSTIPADARLIKSSSLQTSEA